MRFHPCCTAGAAACERSEAGETAWRWSAREDYYYGSGGRRAYQASSARKRIVQSSAQRLCADGADMLSTKRAREQRGACSHVRRGHRGISRHRRWLSRASSTSKREANAAREKTFLTFRLDFQTAGARGGSTLSLAPAAPPAARSCVRPQLRASRVQRKRALNASSARRLALHVHSAPVVRAQPAARTARGPRRRAPRAPCARPASPPHVHVSAAKSGARRVRSTATVPQARSRSRALAGDVLAAPRGGGGRSGVPAAPN